ncbi:MAG: hypothetical protein K6E92_00050 [Lachnospiraceae bacterium]|nr:hypothetical protein [Lachnospiraceae bacterium]
MDCDPPTDGLVDFHILQNGFSGSVNVGQEYLDIWWDLEWSSLDIAVSEAYFSERGNIHCLAQLFPKNSIRLEFDLVSDGTEYHMENMGVRNAYASCLTGDGELSVLVNGHEKRPVTDGCSPAGTALLFMESNEEGHLLYCSDPAAGLMEKMLFHTKDGWKTFETEDLTTMIQGYPTGLLFTGGGIGYMTVTYHGEPIYLYRCEKDGNWIPYQMDVGETRYSYVDGEYAGRIYGKYILRLKVVTGEKDSHIRMESQDGEWWELIRE